MLILCLALIAKVERDNLQKASFEENIQGTSLTAAIQPSQTTALARSNRVQTSAMVEQSFFADIDNIPKKKWDANPPADLEVQVAMVKDLNSGTELFGLNSHSRWAIASLTKLMSALITMENVGKEKNIPITEKAWDTEGVAGDFQVGEIYKAGDLIKAMLVVSSNDAVAAISEFYGETNFVEAMQKKAADLGMDQTTFIDPTGLSFVNQSSANDLEKLVRYILEYHPELMDVTRQKTTDVLEINSGRKRILTNINYFAGREDFLGGKTGFIDAAGQNLISIFKYKNHRIFVIIFGTEDKYKQTDLLYNWIKSSYEF